MILIQGYKGMESFILEFEQSIRDILASLTLTNFPEGMLSIISESDDRTSIFFLLTLTILEYCPLQASLYLFRRDSMDFL